MYNSKYDSSKTTVLQTLREAAKLSQQDAADYFAMKDRRSVGEWERGVSRPHQTRGQDFIYYLLDKLQLRRQPQRFVQIWQEVMVDQWSWKMPTAAQLHSFFPGSFRQLEVHDQEITLTFAKPAESVPFSAPPRPPFKLVGRDALLDALKQRLLAPHTLGLYALQGLPGVGKTALAIELAHDPQVRAHLDGVLWARLGRQPNVVSLLAGWGRTLGLSESEVEKLTTVEAWAERIQAKIGGRRMLLVADDAWQTESALALKVGGPNCTHLTTTRLPQIAVHFAGPQAIVVPELDAQDGLNLLQSLSPSVVASEPEQARKLVKAVGGLPLGLVLMGNFLRIFSLSGQTQRLNSTLERLQHLQKERLGLAQPQSPLERHPSLPLQMHISLETIIAISEQALDPAARQTLTTLSVFMPKPNSFSQEAALAVSNGPQQALDSLADFGLLEADSSGRYTLHQTIADYASVRNQDESAWERMVDFNVNLTQTHASAYSVLELEVDNVRHALRASYERGLDDRLLSGANAFFGFLKARGRYTDAETICNWAEHAARRTENPVGLATSLYHQALMSKSRGLYEQAETHCHQGLALAKESAAHELASSILACLGELTARSGDYEQSQTYLREGLHFALHTEDQAGIGALYKDLGILAHRNGLYDESLEHLQRALELAQESETDGLLCEVLQALGTVNRQLGRYEQAQEHYQHGLRLAQEAGRRERILALSDSLGLMALHQGDLEKAQMFLQQSLALAKEIGQYENVNQILNNLGAAAATSGDYEQAQTYFDESLRFAQQVGRIKSEGIASQNLGMLARERGDYERARQHLQNALCIAKEINSPESIGFGDLELGLLALKEDDYPQAEQYLQAGLAIAREIGDRELTGILLVSLAALRRKQGEPTQARIYLQAVTAIVQGMTYAPLLCEMQLEQGLLHLSQGQGDLAETDLLACLRCAQENGLQEHTAKSLYALAQAVWQRGDSAQARAYAQESLAVFESMGHRDAAKVQVWLANLPT